MTRYLPMTGCEYGACPYCRMFGTNSDPLFICTFNKRDEIITYDFDNHAFPKDCELKTKDELINEH